jgi:methionine-rich copper-binding protein CopC
MRRVGLSAVFAAVIMCLGMATAWAHGDVVKMDPKKNASVELPEVVAVTLTEAPVPQSKLAITDGCGRDVTDEVTVRGEILQASIDDAQPGEWTAAFRAVSAVDGHQSEADWSFTVEGTADCDGDTEEIAPTDDPSPEPTESSDDASSNAAGDDSTTNSSDSEEGSFPVVPVVIGGVALVAVAAAVRARSAG